MFNQLFHRWDASQVSPSVTNLTVGAASTGRSIVPGLGLMRIVVIGSHTVCGCGEMRRGSVVISRTALYVS